jgi:hypothetical protein
VDNGSIITGDDMVEMLRLIAQIEIPIGDILAQSHLSLFCLPQLTAM